MEQSFWTGRWSEGRIGFHKEEPNAWLVKYLEAFQLADPANILVPLCGKSVDLIWLAEKGHTVTGIEFVPQALEDFITEQKLEVNRTSGDGISGAQIPVGSGQINYLVADFLNFPNSRAGNPSFIYDRAALIALPPTIRSKYVERIKELSSPGTQMLLVTIEYPKDKADGPPFAIDEQDVQSYYADGFSIEVLRHHSSAPLSDRLKSVGIAEVSETVYKLVRK